MFAELEKPLISRMLAARYLPTTNCNRGFHTGTALNEWFYHFIRFAFTKHPDGVCMLESPRSETQKQKKGNSERT